MNRLRHSLFVLGISLSLALSGFFVPFSVHEANAKLIPITNVEYVRNGTFDLYGSYGEPTSWTMTGTGSGVQPNASQDGGPAMNLQGIAETLPQVFQQLRLPSTITGVQVAADFQTNITGSPSSFLPEFAMSIATTSSVLVTLYDSSFSVNMGWQSVNRALTAGEVSSIQSAIAAGESIFVVFTLYQDAGAVSEVLIDNVSFLVEGTMTIPDLVGSIAYIGLDSVGYAKTVNRIQPDGSGKSVVWTHPSTIPETNAMFDVAWKPDATEIAFSSNHEIGYSAFHSDVFGIKPDSTGLRRITNPPGLSELNNGSFQFGKVKGSISNDYGSVTTFMVYVQGAKSPVSVNVGDFGDTVSFPETDVADLGAGLHYVVFIWSKGDSGICHEYAPAVVDAKVGQTVDTGTLPFSGTCGTYNSESISWKRDGTQIAVDVLTPRKFASAGEAIGSELFTGAVFPNQVAWSPVDDKVLYHDKRDSGSSSGIYQTTDGGNAGTHIVQDGYALWVTPAWLPDGSGFVYTIDHEIHQYLFAGSQDTVLAQFNADFVFNPSVSPDGNYIVFEWQESYFGGNNHNLWIMNRNSPNQMWPLTTDNRSTDPDWSRVNVPNQGSCTAVTGVSIQGPSSGSTGWPYAFTANIQPANASSPSYQWDSSPISGGATATATYKWNAAGNHKITVEVTNCGGSTANASHTITIQAGSSQIQDVYLPAVIRP